MGEPVLNGDAQEYSTDVMPLVAYLMHEGYTPQATDFDEDERRCYWVFLLSPALMKKVGLYVAGDAQVEPKNFSAMYYRIARERSRIIKR